MGNYAMAMVKGKVTLFGGSGPMMAESKEVHVFDEDSSKWTVIGSLKSNYADGGGSVIAML